MSNSSALSCGGVPSGLPQEQVLSPVSFCIFLNALEKERNILRIKFMDDTKSLDAFNINQDRVILQRESREDGNGESL